jgi:hypothetical protein
MPHIDKDEPLKGHHTPGPSEAAKRFFGVKAKDPADMEHASPSATGSKIPEIDELWRIRAEIQRVAGQNAAENPHRKTILKDLRRLEQQAEDAAVAKLAGQYNINADPKAFDLDITTKEDARVWNRVETEGGRYQVIPGYEDHTVRYDRKTRRYAQPNLDGPASGYHEFTPDKATLAKFQSGFAAMTESETSNFTDLVKNNPRTTEEVTEDKSEGDRTTTTGTTTEPTTATVKIPHTHSWDGHRYTPTTLGGEKYVERHGDYATHKGVFRTDIRGIPRFQRWDEDATKQRTEVKLPEPVQEQLANIDNVKSITTTDVNEEPTAGDPHTDPQVEATVNPPPETASLFNAETAGLFNMESNIESTDSFNKDLASVYDNPFGDGNTLPWDKYPAFLGQNDQLPKGIFNNPANSLSIANIGTKAAFGEGLDLDKLFSKAQTGEGTDTKDETKKWSDMTGVEKMEIGSELISNLAQLDELFNNDQKYWTSGYSSGRRATYG